MKRLRPSDGNILITLGALVLLFAFTGFRYYQGSAIGFVEWRWGPAGLDRGKPEAYEALYEWADHVTEKCLRAEKFNIFGLATFFIILGFVLRAWARDRARLHALTQPPMNDADASD